MGDSGLKPGRYLTAMLYQSEGPAAHRALVEGRLEQPHQQEHSRHEGGHLPAAGPALRPSDYASAVEITRCEEEESYEDGRLTSGLLRPIGERLTLEDGSAHLDSKSARQRHKGDEDSSPQDKAANEE